MSKIDWPALVIGLVMAFYWGRVIKLVVKTRRLHGKSAHFVPPELLGRLLRIIWYPNVAAWITIPLVLAFVHTHHFSFQRFWRNPVPGYVAVVAALVALYLTLLCWRKMGKDWRMGIDPNEKNTLIITGPYALVRHPIYALQCTLAALSFIAVPVGSMAVVAIVQIFLLSWEARREEQHMLSVHGDSYGDYMRQVGRFFPRGRYRATAA